MLAKKKKNPQPLSDEQKIMTENNNMATRIVLSMKLARKQPVIRPKGSV